MTKANETYWRFWPLAIVAGLLPLGTSLLSAWIAMSVEAVPSCFLYTEGCTSISATGRYVPASYVFRGLMLPYTTLLAAYWFLVAGWLKSLKPSVSAYTEVVKWLGVTAAALLALYLVMLGSDGRLYGLMRRYGIYLFFLFTFIAQVMTAFAYRRRLPRCRVSGYLQFAACAFVLVTGLLNVFARQIVEDPDPVQNVTEWNAASIMFLNFCVLAVGWRATDYRWTLRTE